MMPKRDEGLYLQARAVQPHHASHPLHATTCDVPRPHQRTPHQPSATEDNANGRRRGVPLTRDSAAT